jgi:hypothetical protein
MKSPIGALGNRCGNLRRGLLGSWETARSGITSLPVAVREQLRG